MYVTVACCKHGMCSVTANGFNTVVTFEDYVSGHAKFKANCSQIFVWHITVSSV